MSESGDQQLWQQLSLYFLYLFVNPVANVTANYICIKEKQNKTLWKDAISYCGG